jgi:hypothetical protein
MSEIAIGVRLLQAPNGYTVKLAIGSDPEVSVPFEFDLSPASRTGDALRGIEQGRCSTDDLRDVGGLLWDGMFDRSLAAKFREACRSADLVTLHLQVPEELERLPWETLYDKQLRYVACHPSINVVHVGDPDGRRALGAAQPSLAMLVVIPQNSDLDVETEWSNIRTAVAKLGEALQLDSIRNVVTPALLGAKLRSRHWGVVHFIGHGQVVDNRLEVRLNDDGGGDRWLNADQFTAVFMGAKADVGVLNCCHGGTSTNVLTLDRLAPGLLSAGLQAVVAMRYAMADRDAILFSRAFYSELLRGDRPGRVAVAAQLARKALLESASRDDRRGFVAPIITTAGSEPVCLPIARAEPVVPPPPVVARPSEVPSRLRQAIAERRCVLVVGHDLVAPPADRRGPPSHGIHGLIEALSTRLPELETDDAVPAAAPPAPDGYWVPPEAQLRRIAEHYFACKRGWERLVEIVCNYYAPQPPSELHRLLVGWQSPAMFYTHFDGLMESAHRLHERVCTTRSLTDGLEPVDRVLVLVRGSINDVESLVLTEHEHFDLAGRIERMHPSLASLGKPRGNQLRCVLFVGASATDTVTRQLARKLLMGPRVPETFFVSSEGAVEDEYFWRRFDARFVRADTGDFIRAAGPGGGGR